MKPQTLQMNLVVRPSFAASLMMTAVLAAVPEPGCGLPGVLGTCFDAIAQRFGGGGAAEGLRQFKGAFGPQWERLYLVAPSLPLAVLAGAEIANGTDLSTYNARFEAIGRA